MTSPKVSIITPSYNQGRFIEDTILSILNQNYPNLEHIVIDGGSSDNTIEILQRYTHIKWISERDRGQSDAFNKGLKLAGGEIIGWLNSDDLYADSAIQKVVQAFHDDPSVDVVYGNCYYVDENNEVIRKYISGSFDLKRLLTCGYCYIPPMSTFIKKEVFKKLDYPLDENLHFCMDHDLFIRIANAGFRFKYIPEYLSSFRRSSLNKTTIGIKKMRRESYSLSKKYGGGRGIRLHLNYLISKIYLFNPFLTDVLRRIRYRLSMLRIT